MRRSSATFSLLANTCIESTSRFATVLGYDETLVRDATAAFSHEHMHAAHDLHGTTFVHAKHLILRTKSQNRGVLKMLFMILFDPYPDKAQTPAPADLRESEFQTVRGLYTDGLIQQVWLRGDAGGACMIVEGASTDEVAAKLNALPLVCEGYVRPPTIVPLKPYSGFASRS
jgi:Isochorismatase family